MDGDGDDLEGDNLEDQYVEDEAELYVSFCEDY